MKAWKAGLERHFVLIRERMFLSGIFLSGMLLLARVLVSRPQVSAHTLRQWFRHYEGAAQIALPEAGSLVFRIKRIQLFRNRRINGHAMTLQAEPTGWDRFHEAKFVTALN